MNKFTVPDICDEFEDKIQIGDLFLNSYGLQEKFYGKIQTARCEHSNKVVKEIVTQNVEDMVLFIQHTGIEKCSMVGDQIAQMAYENGWKGIITNGYIRDAEVIKEIPIGVYALNTYPKKTDKSIGVGEIGVNLEFDKFIVRPDEWIYVDINGWVISEEELKF